MGWTHHWERNIELLETTFCSAVADLKKVVEQGEVVISGSGGQGEPTLNSEAVLFNGGNGLACEDCEINRVQPSRTNRPRAFSYCKTEKLPYDLYVQATLIIFKHHFGNDITVGSDAGDDDWHDARELCQRVLNYGSDFKLAEIT